MFRMTKSSPPAAAPRAEDPATPCAEPAPPPRGAPLFDAGWYARHAVSPEAEPAADYFARGTHAARSPCPLFSPAWYRTRYPDIALAGLEPLEHWLLAGWREGRDPSALFSTSAYLSAHPEAGADGADPLSHYLSCGRAGGARPHPKVWPGDPAVPDLGVVVAYQGDMAALELALWALDHALTGPAALSATVYLVDGASPPERTALDELAARRGERLRIVRHHERRGSALALLANAGLWKAMQGGGHSHLGLVDQACLVPAGLFEGLVDLWAPVAAPVLNRAATSQSVPIDFDIYASAAPLEAVAGYAARRREIIPGAVELADRVEPACVLFERGALEAAGLLDETAAAADALAQTLASAARLGLGGAVIARHLYAHRLERSPVSVTPADPLRGAVALARSEAADARALARWSPSAPQLIEAHAARSREAAETLAREVAGLRARLDRLDGRAQLASAGRERVLCPWDEIAFADTPAPPRQQDPAPERLAYRRLQSRVWAALIEADLARFDVFRGVQPVVAGLARLFAERRPVLVLTMDTDPVTGDEKDGYVQRVVAIDKALAGQDRIYLKMVAKRRGRPALVFLEAGIWRLEIAHRDPVGEALLEAVLRHGACVYSQSLVGIDPPAVRRLLPSRTGPLIMDMHGAVPEEFVLYENHYMAQKYADYERWAAREADITVCVTEAMAEHFAEKLEIDRARLLVCPIYVHGAEEGAPERPYNARPRAIYAGGTQRWQMIPELARVVADTIEAVDWCLLTPDVHGMARALSRAGIAAGASGLSLASATQAQVFASYPRCDFGLLLREDCTVNRVACPTKLIEYLRFGVVPVLDTPNVGDFAAMGMAYVPVEAFRAGELPGPDTCAEMAAANHRVFRRLLERSRAGLAEISAAVARQAPSAIVPEPRRETV